MSASRTVLYVASTPEERPQIGSHADDVRIETVESAGRCLDRVGGDTVDCIVSEYALPDDTGIELLRAVRSDHPDLPFVLYPEEGDEQVAGEAVAAGVTEYVPREPDAERTETAAERIEDALETESGAADPSEGGAEPAESDPTPAAARQAVLDRVTDAIIEVDEEWRFTLVNEQAEELYGTAAEDLLGRRFWDVFEDAVGTRFETVYREVMQTREPASLVEYYEGLSGWFDVQIYPNDDGGLSFYFRDVTERRQQRRQLEIAEARYRALAENFPNGAVFYFDTDCEYRVVAGQGFEELDTDSEDLVGNQPGEVDPVPAAISERMRSAMETTLAGEAVETRLCYENRVYELHSEPIRDTEGTVTAGLFITQEVTQRHQQTQALVERDDRFQYVERTADIGYFEVDPGTEEPYDIRLSDGVYQIYDLPPETSIDVAEALDYYYPEDRPVVASAVERAVEEAEPYSHEGRITTAEGRDRWVRSAGEPIEEDGTVVRVRGVLQDVTERKRQEEQLKRQNDRLEEFASIVSHDLKNPLMVARGNVELVKATTESERLDRAEKALARGQTLIEELLTLANHGAESLDPEPVDLAALARTCRDNVEADGAGFEVTTDRTLRADRQRLTQLFENLFRNSVEHGSTGNRTQSGDTVEHGGDAVSVWVGELADGFYVADDGHGIPEDEREAVFETGYSTADDGTGFGLHIVQRVARDHGWSVAVTDSAEGGARFEVTGVDFTEQ